MPTLNRNPPSRADAWEWMQAGLLVANLAWTTLCLGGYLPRTQVITGVLTLLLMLAHGLGRSMSRRPSTPLHPAGWLLLPFIAYAASNVIWVTPVPWLGWIDWFWWAQIAVVFWVVLNGARSVGPRRLVIGTLYLLAVVAVLLACFQRYVDRDWLMLGRVQPPQYFGRASGPFGIPNSLGAFLILLIPPAAGLAVRRDAPAAERVLFGWLSIVLSVGLVLTVSRGAMLSLAFAVILWPLLSSRWRLRRRLFVAIGALILVTCVGISIYRSSNTVRERFQLMARDMGELSRPIMWRAAWKIFASQPVVGSGAGSYNVLFERHRPEREQTEPQWAHNDYLNTLSDYGVVGVVLGFGAAGIIAIFSLRSHARLARKSVRTAVARPEVPAVPLAWGIGLLAFALHLFVDFHLKIPALGLAFATIAGLTVAAMWPFAPGRDLTSPATMGERRWVYGVVFIGCVIGGTCGVLPRLHAEGLRYDVRERINRLVREGTDVAGLGLPATQALAELKNAAQVDPRNAQVWADRCYASAIIARADPARSRELGEAAERDARRALALGNVVPEFWLRLGVALDMQGRWVEAGDAFAEALRLAPSSTTTWFYQAYHLALNPVTFPLARSAVATCLRLDPSNREADSLRRYLSGGR